MTPSKIERTGKIFEERKIEMNGGQERKKNERDEMNGIRASDRERVPDVPEVDLDLDRMIPAMMVGISGASYEWTALPCITGKSHYT